MSDFPYEKEVVIVAGNSQVNIHYIFPSEPGAEGFDELKYSEQI